MQIYIADYGIFGHFVRIGAPWTGETILLEYFGHNIEAACERAYELQSKWRLPVVVTFFFNGYV